MALPDLPQECWDIIVHYLDPKSWLRASLAFRSASAANPAYMQRYHNQRFPSSDFAIQRSQVTKKILADHDVRNTKSRISCTGLLGMMLFVSSDVLHAEFYTDDDGVKSRRACTARVCGRSEYR
jgi:hypothetical protein